MYMYAMSGDYTKSAIGSSLPSSHQVLKCIELDGLSMKVDL